jgi:hypothetical protein
MRLERRVRAAVRLTGLSLLVLGCGGGARQRAAAPGPVPEVVKQLQVPENPYRIIYTPPVNLAKPPDTTARAKKARD